MKRFLRLNLRESIENVANTCWISQVSFWISIALVFLQVELLFHHVSTLKDKEVENSRLQLILPILFSTIKQPLAEIAYNCSNNDKNGKFYDDSRRGLRHDNCVVCAQLKLRRRNDVPARKDTVSDNFSNCSTFHKNYPALYPDFDPATTISSFSKSTPKCLTSMVVALLPKFITMTYVALPFNDRTYPKTSSLIAVELNSP